MYSKDYSKNLKTLNTLSDEDEQVSNNAVIID